MCLRLLFTFDHVFLLAFRLRLRFCFSRFLTCFPIAFLVFAFCFPDFHVLLSDCVPCVLRATHCDNLKVARHQSGGGGPTFTPTCDTTDCDIHLSAWNMSTLAAPFCGAAPPRPLLLPPFLSPGGSLLRSPARTYLAVESQRRLVAKSFTADGRRASAPTRSRP